ncbi:hypothetical protein D5R55_29205 [Burkholderia cenocepacia]|uniref:Transthyretin/hydroxyisourate hydrolase domain-containing protein n=1 Tax=Burkholderia cenocepacia TaxID=95486 RepID=A0A3S9NLG0_9BURK|nr:hypothetical protein D5R55_29205 [Burkholderia cenocepacia]
MARQRAASAAPAGRAARSGRRRPDPRGPHRDAQCARARGGGDFELRFHLGEYFSRGDALLDVVPVRFTETNPAQHYHVPLLCSPWYVSTYCGSRTVDRRCEGVRVRRGASTDRRA